MSTPNAWLDTEPVRVAAEQMLLATDAMRQNGQTIYPPHDQVLRALELCPPEQCRCVIVGQDPYHGHGQACGLSFSVAPDCAMPPSLRNIFDKLVSDIGCPYPSTGDLTPWAERGVLLLNSTLTVEGGRPASHAGMGWEQVTGHVLTRSLYLPQTVVYLLWGRKAQDLMESVSQGRRDIYHKYALTSSHPSPYSVKSGPRPFAGSHPFSTTNKILKAEGETPIDWKLP